MPQPRSASRNRAAKPGDVGAFLAALDHPRKAEIEAVRALILGADPRVREGIKWNAPSFFVTEHFATFKLRPEATVQLVLHTDAKGRADLPVVRVDDPAGLLAWAAPDRAVATLRGMDDVQAGGAALVEIVREWIRRTAGEAR